MKGEELEVTAKSVGLTGNDVRKKYNNSFRDLKPGTTYHDPIGARGRKQSMKKAFFEAQKDAIDLFEEKHIEKNFSLWESTQQVRKSLDTGDWALPIYHVPDVSVINPQQTPLADLLPRVSVQNDTVKVQAVDDGGFPSVTWAFSGDTSSERTYDYADSSYSTYSYDITEYDAGTLIEDKLVLSANKVRNATSVAQTNLIHAMRIEEEKQLIQGDGTNSGSANDSNGWSGLVDLNTAYESVSDPTTYSDDQWINKTRELITQVEKKGGDIGSTGVVVGFDAYRYLANALQDFTRYDVMGTDSIDFGFKTLQVDGVPIYKSHGFEDEIGDASPTSSNPWMIALDMGSNYFGTLQDVTLQPLPKTGPQEKVAVDSYTTLVSEAKPHIQWYDFS